VGSELIAFAERRTAEVSPALFLCVSSFNERARALYERLGFRRVGELPDYVERGYSEILMCKQRQSWNEFLADE
jgi:ribosomal protein S18 acetylase RimI-like enzyme